MQETTLKRVYHPANVFSENPLQTAQRIYEKGELPV